MDTFSVKGRVYNLTLHSFAIFSISFQFSSSSKTVLIIFILRKCQMRPFIAHILHRKPWKAVPSLIVAFSKLFFKLLISCSCASTECKRIIRTEWQTFSRCTRRISCNISHNRQFSDRNCSAECVPFDECIAAHCIKAIKSNQLIE